jgi:hypothetical protein
MKKRAASGTTEIKKIWNVTKLKRENFSSAEDSKKLLWEKDWPQSIRI